ncbi:RagB/SusD family nutrient uptake outer membrane protein [Parapedobacter soli]|uniref:RagB/SusD family nutrient uptake outer membrane protein n=1 Tax=Parapedobacter soli TaxID=416955 RepID=UPI0021C74F2E|nr:RagB/SusD family nutrient uptake outer membrane protein [Parapedobacter soli]
MKAIRNIQFVAMVSIGLLLGTSCSGLLDEPLENQQIAEGTDYTQTQNMVLMLYGAYNQLYDMGWEVYPTISVRGDDIDIGGRGDQPLFAEADSFRYDRNFWALNNAWTSLYSDLIYWQGAIEEIQKYQEAGANQGTAQQYIAEIKVMQGFEFLQLARMWGSILIPTTSQPSQLFNAELSSFEQVMQHVSALMDEAIPLLPTVRPNQRTDIPGGITRYTAYAVKALANLELKNYPAVAEATGQIISSGLFSLEPDFYHLFKLQGKLNNENLLELQYSDYGTPTGTSNKYLWDFFGPTSWTPARSGSSGGWGFWEPSMKYIQFMLDRGERERLEATVIFTPDGITELRNAYPGAPSWISNVTADGDQFNNSVRTKFYSGKHYWPSTMLTQGRTAYGENKNFTCIRYAEVLLIHAEALVNGATSSAMTADAAVNEVRGRVGLGPLSSVTLDQVLDEKLAEFAGEWGIRFYDLVRNGRTAELSYGGRTYDAATDRFYPYPLQQQDILPQLRDQNQ